MEGNDRIFSDRESAIADFKFDDRVAEVFPDMIKRSVPGYEEIIFFIGIITGQFARSGTVLYDLGCSLGAATLAMRHNVPPGTFRIIAVDNSPAMLSRCRRILDTDSASVPCELVEGDVGQLTLEPASVVVLNFTLQFVPPAERTGLLQRVAEALVPGGVLVLSEKISFPAPRQNQFYSDIHHAFKKRNGYSELEISRKRTALENVLVPEPLTEHTRRLHEVGFSRIDIWYQCFNFMSLIAFR